MTPGKIYRETTVFPVPAHVSQGHYNMYVGIFFEEPSFTENDLFIFTNLQLSNPEADDFSDKTFVGDFPVEELIAR